MYSVGGNLIGSSVLQLFFVPVNRVILTQWAGPAAVSVYELANNGSIRFRNIFETGLRAVMPEVSRLAAGGRDGRQQIAALHRRAMRMLLLLVLPLYACLWLVSPLLIQLWLGPARAVALPGALRAGLAGTMISLVGVPAFYVLLGLGETRPLLVEKALQLGISLSVTFGVLVLFDRISPFTALVAGGIGMAGSTVYLLYSYRVRMRALDVRHLNGADASEMAVSL